MSYQATTAYLIGGPNHGSQMVLSWPANRIQVAEMNRLGASALDDTSQKLFRSGEYSVLGPLRHHPDTGKPMPEGEAQKHLVFEWVGWLKD